MSPVGAGVKLRGCEEKGREGKRGRRARREREEGRENERPGRVEREENFIKEWLQGSRQPIKERFQNHLKSAITRWNDEIYVSFNA